MLIHATVTITGDAAQLAACEARVRDLLSGASPGDEVTERHRPGALCYGLKVAGGIPFPAFAGASQQFPDLTFDAEWVNVATGEQCSVTLVNGRITRHDVRTMPG